MVQHFSSILHILQHNAQQQPQALALADTRRNLHCAAYWHGICAAARLLQRRLTQGAALQGARILLICTQDIPYLLACHAVQLAGGLAVPLEKNCAPARVAEIAVQTAAIALFCPQPLPVLSQLPQFSAEQLFEEAMAAAAENTSLSDLPQSSLPQAQDSSLILFTTGTTGSSKGIELSHGADVAVAENVYYGVQMKAGHREILPMPLNHSFALRRYFATQLAGGATLILNGLLAMKKLFVYLEQYQAGSLALAPAAYTLIRRLSGNKLADYQQQLDFLQFGSAPLPEEDKQQLRQLLPGCRLYNIYGSTEAGCAAILDFSQEDYPHCIGRPTRNAQARLLDEQGHVISQAGCSGRLAWSGSMCMKGYWQEETLNLQIRCDGYLLSSDMGQWDAQGRLYMLGRADDVINWGGLKIAPTEIEDAALGFSGVGACACVALPDALEGQVVALFVEADAPQTALDVEALRAYLAAQLESYKVPRRIVLLPALPRTYNGKLDRKALRGNAQN